MDSTSQSPVTLDALRARREAILQLTTQHGAYNVRVFGSVARGDAKPESDIDLLVEWDMVRISSWAGAGLDVQLSALLGRRVQVVTLADLHWSIRDQVRNEAVAL